MIPESPCLKVLIIDSSKEKSETLSNFLNSKGIESITTNDAMEGLLHIRQENYDAVLLDIDMSVISGLGVIEFLAGEDTLKNQKIFIMSEDDIPEIRLKHLLRKDGIQGILKKSLNYDELLNSISPEFAQKS